MSVDTAILKKDFELVVRRLKGVRRDLNVKDRKKFLTKAARKVATVSRRAVTFGGKRGAAKGVGPQINRRPFGEYRPGNLRSSIRVINFRKSQDAFIGPRFNKKGTVFGPPSRRADGYYAAMIYGSAALFRERELNPALRAARQEALSIIRRGTQESLTKRGRGRGLNIK